MPPLPPPSLFTGVDTATLQQWLARAQTAYFNLSMGLSATEVVTQGDVVKFQRADLGQLASLISQIQAQLAGRTTAGAIGVVF